jgi:hypothetical protein
MWCDNCEVFALLVKWNPASAKYVAQSSGVATDVVFLTVSYLQGDDAFSDIDNGYSPPLPECL